MGNSSDTEKILRLFSSSLLVYQTQISVPDIQDNIYVEIDDPVVYLAEKISSEGGKFFYCQSEDDLVGNLKNLIQYRKWSNIASYSKSLWAYLDGNEITTLLSHTNAKIGISLCQGIVARTGSIILTSLQGIGNNLIHFPPIFIIIASTGQIFNSYKQILSLLPETPPEWVVSIRSGKLINEEIKELYLFVMES